MTEQTPRPLLILLADDDEDDRLLTSEAIEESQLNGVLHCVGDGEELMQYLQRSGAYAQSDESAPRPDLILLDLNMPRKDGREALREIKADANLRSIPVVVLTTSKAEEDVLRTYDLGVNSFITKPVTYDELVNVMSTLNSYWAQTVQLPRHGN